MIQTTEKKGAPFLDLLVKHLHVRSWEINITKTQGPSTSVKFLGV